MLRRWSSQCFPFYTYDEDGTNRRENITDWALNEFRTHYSDPYITKWDIFHYVYAVLHHPEYRERYAANLKRELPRIPFVGDCRKSSAGLQASVESAERDPSSLPKAGAHQGAERAAAALARDEREPTRGAPQRRSRCPTTPPEAAPCSG